MLSLFEGNAGHGFSVAASVQGEGVDGPAVCRLRQLCVQGYLAHKKHPPPRTLQWDYT